MKLRVFKSIDNDVFAVKLQPEDWSEADRGLMVRYGEPEIDLGGTFDSGNEVTFELPTKLVRLVGDFPVTQRFDARDAADAEDRANLWAETLVARITEAVDTLRLTPDTFTGELCHNMLPTEHTCVIL